MQWKPGIFKKLCGVGALITLLSACSSNPANDSSVQTSPAGAQQSTALIQSYGLNNFLTNAPANGSLFLVDGRWGAKVDVIADQDYFSAGGRRCRKAQVISEGGATRNVLVCEVSPGQWMEVRPVTELLVNP